MEFVEKILLRTRVAFFVSLALAISLGGGVLADETVVVDFETVMLAPGDSVEGLGTVSPHLNIDATFGTAVLVAEGKTPIVYGAPNGILSVRQGCMGNPGEFVSDGGSVYGQGFSDFDSFRDQAASPNTHSYVFGFSPGRTVSEFSIRLLDYGDFNPTRSSFHNVELLAFDFAGAQVDAHVLSFDSAPVVTPRTSDFGNLFLTGDACTAIPDVEPGAFLFHVGGARIFRVELHCPVGLDPNIAFDDIEFTLECPDIDIKPGSDPNSINPDSRGVIPVAILGDPDFDVSEIDPATVTFGPDAAPPGHRVMIHYEDVNEDGLLDVLFHFRTQETGILHGDTEACISWTMFSGTGFTCCDSVRTVPPARANGRSAPGSRFRVRTHLSQIGSTRGTAPSDAARRH